MTGVDLAQLGSLYPALSQRLERVIENMEAEEQMVGAHFGIRTFAQQDMLYALGRTVANIDGKSASQPLGSIVTHARGGQSWHNYGLACDIVFRTARPEAPEGVWHWDWSEKLPWLRLGEAGEAEGLEWGGRWPGDLKDEPHFEMRAGLALTEVQALYSEGNLTAVWREIDRRLGRVS